MTVSGDEEVFRLPDIGEGLAEAEVVLWMVAEGDVVVVDQPVVLVETAKAQVELPTPFAGTVTSLGARAGAVLDVGAPLLTVRTSSAVPAAVPGSVAARVSPAVPVPPSQTSPAAPRARPLAAPSTRRLARELGVELAHVSGTGPAGRVLSSDVEAAVRPAGAAPPAEHPVVAPAAVVPPPVVGARADRVVPLRGLRREIARSMTVAWQVPHVTEFREVDATRLLQAQARLRERAPAGAPRLTLLPLFVLACARALRRSPRFNASLDLEAGTITEHGRVDVGIATSSPDGLLVPVVRNAEAGSLPGLAARIEEVTARARSRTAAPEELRGGTFTVTNFGSFGTWLGVPVIRPPEVAIAGFGRVGDRVVPVDGQPVVRPTLPIVVSADHRLNDGADLAAFVDDVAAYCSDPVLLLGD